MISRHIRNEIYPYCDKAILLQLKMSRQCKTGRQSVHYQSEDANPTQPSHGARKK